LKKYASKLKLKEGINDIKCDDIFNYIKEFGVLCFQSPNEYRFETKDNEVAVLILEGKCDISVDGKDYKGLGRRESVFDGIPTAFYIPIHSSFSIKGTKAKIAICKAKSSVKTKHALIEPEKVKLIDAGKDNWSRKVRLIIGPDSPSVNMILGETINPAGNWSGIPPAKHEKDDFPRESLHEELYYFLTEKREAWGVERIYSPERKVNEFLYLENNTVTFMPWGYHQIVAAPGYNLYYLFFLAGKGNKLAQFEDPAHNWVKKAQ